MLVALLPGGGGAAGECYWWCECWLSCLICLKQQVPLHFLACV